MWTGKRSRRVGLGVRNKVDALVCSAATLCVCGVCRVIRSQEAGHWLPEAPYEMKGDTKAIGGPRKGRECKNNDGQIPGPFGGLTVCLYGHFASPSRSELQG